MLDEDDIKAGAEKRRAFLGMLQALDMRQVDFARIYGLDPRTVSRWGRPRSEGRIYYFPPWVFPLLRSSVEQAKALGTIPRRQKKRPRKEA
jgi:hypothetical protein